MRTIKQFEIICLELNCVVMCLQKNSSSLNCIVDLRRGAFSVPYENDAAVAVLLPFSFFEGEYHTCL